MRAALIPFYIKCEIPQVVYLYFSQRLPSQYQQFSQADVIHINNILMLIGTCQQLRPFNFQSLDEFQFIQLISRSKYFVGLYVNKQQLSSVVKEVPFNQKTVQILKKLDRLQPKNIVKILGVSLFKTKSGWNDIKRLKSEDKLQIQKSKNEEIKDREDNKQYTSLLIFMQRYEMNLHQYVLSRRKKMQLFSREEINSFILQMLALFQQLQRQGLAHRDVKPQNILYNKGKYLLCDFDDMMFVDQKQRLTVDLTTVQYSSPQFLRHIRQPKDKYFDPFKLDVYALGLTLLFMCSMGRFSLEERSNYIYESSQHSHSDFIKENRRKWVRNNPQFRSFNSILKIMLEQDQYKRDDFITLLIKSKGEKDQQNANSEFNVSDDYSNNSKSSAKLKDSKKLKKMLKAKKQAELRVRQNKVYGVLSLFMIVVFIMLCLL